MAHQNNVAPLSEDSQRCLLEDGGQRLVRAVSVTLADADLGAATDMLGRILRNVLQNPLSDAYRRIRLSGKGWSVASQCFVGGSPWLVEWCGEMLGAVVVHERKEEGVSGDLLILGQAWLGDRVPTDRTPLEALQDARLCHFLSMCEGCLRIVERLRNTTVAALRLMHTPSIAPPSAAEVGGGCGGGAFDALAWWRQADTATTGLPEDGFEALLDDEWQWLCNAMCAAAVGASGTQGTDGLPPPPTERTATIWDRMLAAAAATSTGSSSLSILVDQTELRAMDGRRRTTAPASASSSAAKHAAKERSRALYEAAQRAEQVKHRAPWPAELMHTATSLIVDIGGLMEVYAALEAKRDQPSSVGEGLPPTNEAPSAGQIDDTDHGSLPRRDPRVNLTRRDRIEMHRLQEKFRDDGDITYLHVVKAEWTGRLAALRRTMGTPTIFL